MKLYRSILIFIFIIFSITFAKVKVVVSYPWIGYLVNEIGKDKVDVFILGKGTEDPHFIVPKPSYIAKLRNADLLIIQGASLEIGFIPALISQANNPKIQPGNNGFLDLSKTVDLIEKPEKVSRAMGDVHPDGNPHYNLDPNNIPILANAIEMKLSQVDNSNSSFYKSNLQIFLSKWNEKLKYWNEEFGKLRGSKVIEYHKKYDYLFTRYGIEIVETIEPLPGIPPTAKYIQEIISNSKSLNVKYVIVDVYNDKKAAQYVAQSIGAKFVVLPQDIGALPNVNDLFQLFDTILNLLTK